MISNKHQKLIGMEWFWLFNLKIKPRGHHPYPVTPNKTKQTFINMKRWTLLKIQINFTLKIVPGTHEPWKRTAPVHFPSTHKHFPVCFLLPGFPLTCCLNYPPCGLDTDAAFPSSMNTRLSVAQSRLQLWPWLHQLLGPPLLLPSLASRLLLSPPHRRWWRPLVMTHSSNKPHLQKTGVVEGEEEHVCVFDWEFHCCHF